MIAARAQTPCWLTHFKSRQRAGFAIWQPSRWLLLPMVLAGCSRYYKVASSQLPAPQIPRTKVVLQSRQFLIFQFPALLRGLNVVLQSLASSQLPAPQITPRTTVVLQSRQFSSSSSPDTPRTKVVLQSRQFSSSSSAATPRTKVVLQSRQFSASSYPLRVLKLYYNFASSHLPSSPATLRTKVVLQSRHFSSSSSTDTPRTKVVLRSRQFSASSSTDYSAY